MLKEREAFATEHRRMEAQTKREKSKKKRLDDAAMVIQRAWKVCLLSLFVLLIYITLPTEIPSDKENNSGFYIIKAAQK